MEDDEKTGWLAIQEAYGDFVLTNRHLPNQVQLHPLVQGDILERLQFDGDIPELRSGPMPPGASPAVPVRVVTGDPILVGAQLWRASTDVMARLKPSPEDGILACPDGDPGYQTGKLATIQDARVNHLWVQNLTESHQKFAFQAISSSQGRRSIAAWLLERLLEQLGSAGYQVNSLSQKQTNWDVMVEWTTLILSGEKSINPRFNYIRVAELSLFRKLQTKLVMGRQYLLKIATVDEIADRRVGWQALVWEQSNVVSLVTASKSVETELKVFGSENDTQVYDGYRDLWTFRVTGGLPFRLQIKGNRPMVHDGGAESILKSVCTKSQAVRVTHEMKEHYGCRAEMICNQMTPAQRRERKNSLQVLGGDRVFPSANCPGCSWFDTSLDSLCGAGLAKGEGWENEVVEGLRFQGKFEEDLAKCPLANSEE